jgi:hypothetical protein
MQYKSKRSAVYLPVSLFLLAVGTSAYNWKDSRIVRRVLSLPGVLESQFLSAVDDSDLHGRTLSAHAAFLVKGMQETDRRQLKHAFEQGNAAYPRALWRLGLEPISMKVKVDGAQHLFWSDELIFNRYRADHFLLLEAPGFKTRGEFLPWELFRPIQYDQMPRPLAELIIGLQAQRFGKYLEPEQWPEMNINEWRQIPDPIRKIAAYRMTWLWAAEYAPDQMRREEAARILASIGRVESLFDIDKVVHQNPETGKEDLGFLQISEGLRQRLRRLHEFRECNDDDFLKPWISIRAGAYSLFCIFLQGTGGDVLKAIGHYNAGRHGLKQRAAKYLDAVIRQYDRAFVDRRYSPTLQLLLRRAEPGYFRGVQKDLLFQEQQSES